MGGTKGGKPILAATQADLDIATEQMGLIRGFAVRIYHPHHLVQAFIRHRLAHQGTAATPERKALLSALRELDDDEAQLTSTPMIPIHRQTLQRIIAQLETGE